MLYLTDFHHYLRVHVAVSSAVRRTECCFPDSVFSTILPCGVLSLFLCLPPSYAPVVLTWEHHNWFRFSRFLLHINREGTVQLIHRKKYRHQPLLYHRPSGDAEARDTTSTAPVILTETGGCLRPAAGFWLYVLHYRAS